MSIKQRIRKYLEITTANIGTVPEDTLVTEDSLTQLNREIRSRIEKLENKKDDNIELSYDLISWFVSEAGYKVYRVRKESDKDDTYNSRSFSLASLYSMSYSSFISKPEIEVSEISIKDIQTIGKYRTFKIGESEYLLAKKPKGRKNR